MTFFSAVAICFSKYVTFSGRARRAEYWWWALFVFIGGVVFGGADVIFFGVPEIAGPTTVLFDLITFLPGLSVWVRRLHDTDRSGWWTLLILIPLIGWLILLIWTLSKGTDGSNRFGADPITGAETVLRDSAIPPVRRG